MKRIVWSENNSKEVFYDLAADYNTDNFTEAELRDFCREWEKEDAADGLDRQYWIEEE